MDATNAISIVLPMVQAQEGFRATAYWDSNGYAIGYGNHYYTDGTTVDEGDTITQSDAADLMTWTLQQTAAAIAPCITVMLNDNQLAALLDLAYNWGSGNVCKSVLLQLINAGASQDDINSQWAITATTAGGVNNSDLYTRRVDEYSLFDDPMQAITAAVQSVPTWGWLAAAVAIIGGYLYFKDK